MIANQSKPKTKMTTNTDMIYTDQTQTNNKRYKLSFTTNIKEKPKYQSLTNIKTKLKSRNF